MPTIEDIVGGIDRSLSALREEIEQPESARRALSDGRPAATRRPSAPGSRRHPRARRPPPAGNRARRRRAATASPAQVEAIVAAGDGVTTPAVAERAGTPRERVLAILRELEAAGRVRRTGERRATRWHAITDEDRIARRAAEITASGRSTEPVTGSLSSGCVGMTGRRSSS